MAPSIVLVEPEIPENTGFIARLSANFGYSLRLVNPDFNLSEARDTASSAQEKLREARIFDTVEEAIEDLDYVIGTKPGKGVELKDFEPREDTSIMIGRESNGLSNKELEMCDAVVHIDTGDYESVNQSHAASILMYSLKSREEGKVLSNEKKKVLEESTSEMVGKLLLRSNPSPTEFERLMAELN